MKDNWKPFDLDNLPRGDVLFRDLEGYVFFGSLELYRGEIWCDCQECYISIYGHYFDPDDLGEPEPDIFENAKMVADNMSDERKAKAKESIKATEATYMGQCKGKHTWDDDFQHPPWCIKCGHDYIEEDK